MHKSRPSDGWLNLSGAEATTSAGVNKIMRQAISHCCLLLLYFYHFYTGYVQLHTWKKTVFLEYIMLQVFCGYNIWYMEFYFPWEKLCTFILLLHEACVLCPIWLFSVIPWCNYQVLLLLILFFGNNSHLFYFILSPLVIHNIIYKIYIHIYTAKNDDVMFEERIETMQNEAVII
jgi:hypothetical protein